MTTQRRPGGRSARVREDVHAAVIELLLTSSWDQMTVPTIAASSGVHQATLYRRWGTVSAIISDIISVRLQHYSPLPGTGTLREDLTSWESGMAQELASAEGRVFLRAALAVGLPIAEDSGDDRPSYLPERSDGVRAMLLRASDRGELVPTQIDIFEFVIAPIYAYALFNRPVPPHIKEFIDRVLAVPSTTTPS